MKVFFLLFFVGMISATAFADDEDATAPNDSESVGSCPEYSPPVCAYGQKVVSVNGGNGCSVPVCAGPVKDDEEFQPEGCPTLAIPTCKAGQVQVHHTDFNRCPYTLCEDKK